MRKSPKLTRGQRLYHAAPQMYAFVKDYFDQCDCGNGGEHNEQQPAKGCWHCTTRSLIDYVEKGKPIK